MLMVIPKAQRMNEAMIGAGTGWKRQRREQPTGRAYPKEHQSPPANIYLHEADLWIERKMQERKMKYERKRCFGGVRYADGEYAAEQPQGLPAVIAELTRWAAQNLELTFQSEINGRTKRLREGRSESIRMEIGRRGEREIFEPASSKQQRLKSRCALACSLGV
ncbi:unnamed protein product [Ilex paraguariensis]|uniref:Uncharacterized protein n=1 Tax=Ilex paraguariensis TaxID=185542 RepID=A0ABC8SV28_9AQUA